MEQYELYGLNVVGVANFVHRRVSQMIDLWLQIVSPSLGFLFVFCKLVDATAELMFQKKKRGHDGCMHCKPFSRFLMKPTAGSSGMTARKQMGAPEDFFFKF